MANITEITNTTHKSAIADNFDEMYKGGHIDSAVIQLKKYAWVEGQISPPSLYRKFFYGKNGKVVKKLGFDTNEDLELKEENVFTNGLLKVKLLTTNDSIWTESYKYDKNKRVTEYQFVKSSLHQSNPEIVNYEYDKQGRKSLKKYFARTGFLQFVTEYVYPSAKSKRYSFRSVTDDKGNLIITFIYSYNSKGKLTRLAELDMHYKEYKKLSAEDKEAAILKSKAISNYLYGKNGHMEKYIRTIPKGEVVDLISPYLSTGDFVITQERGYKHGKYKNRSFITSIIEYDPKYREPIQVHEYTYYDKDNNVIALIEDKDLMIPIK